MTAAKLSPCVDHCCAQRIGRPVLFEFAIAGKLAANLRGLLEFGAKIDQHLLDGRNVFDVCINTEDMQAAADKVRICKRGAHRADQTTVLVPRVPIRSQGAGEAGCSTWLQLACSAGWCDGDHGDDIQRPHSSHFG